MAASLVWLALPTLLAPFHGAAVPQPRLDPRVAVFHPGITERTVPVVEQVEIADALTARLAPRFVVEPFDATEGVALADWMTPLLNDGVQDVVVLIDLVPDTLYAGEADGSLVEEWLEHGNAIVWTGALPLGGSVDPAGNVAIFTLALDSILDSGPYVGFGIGNEALKPTTSLMLPSLTAIGGRHSIQHNVLAPPWRVRRAFTVSPLKASDAVELVRDGGGVYAQFYCRQATGFPRAAVLGEYLELLLHAKAKPR